MNWFIRLVLLICSMSWGMSTFETVSASGYVPTTTWPYLYEDFVDGTVYFSKEQKTMHLKLNVHLQNCTLHYLEGDKVMQADPRNVEMIQLGDVSFIYMNGELVRFIKAEEGVALVKLVKADLDELNKNTHGAYGMSTTSSSVNQIVSIGALGVSNLIYTRMRQERKEGKDLPLIEKYYFIFGDKIVEATRKEVEKSLGDNGKTKLKAFLKQNKIKWKEEASLIKLLEFFHQ
ncbi:hypothetical protein H8784_19005 [Parabacteroides acidifaciens]|uniref:DUF4369 domain-containing protein n=1 Tax=Parabacteroides acidifaciens TaxID=2290935 RepID=A0ABR7P615_9BACT|nr:hypothetical protein [Parabacteroides acidifaciens]MBC8603801.1 hypothetical protein [Parabacteroides acidifaciens]